MKPTSDESLDRGGVFNGASHILEQELEEINQTAGGSRFDAHLPGSGRIGIASTLSCARREYKRTAIESGLYPARGLFGGRLMRTTINMRERHDLTSIHFGCADESSANWLFQGTPGTDTPHPGTEKSPPAEGFLPLFQLNQGVSVLGNIKRSLSNRVNLYHIRENNVFILVQLEQGGSTGCRPVVSCSRVGLEHPGTARFVEVMT